MASACACCGTKQLPAPPPRTEIRVDPKNKVDLLFAIENSPGGVYQTELTAQFPVLAKVLDDFGRASPADYHIGVVTSDMGAGQFNLGGGQCHPGGDGGKLQALGAGHAANCIAPTGGLNFVDYDQLTGTNNLPAGQDLATTFTCMATVGDRGCGFESQLESVYAALHDPPVENQGFLRDDALLVVLWVADEDDNCSAPPDSDLFDPALNAAPPNGFGPLLSYRASEYGVMCPFMGVDQLLPYAFSGGNLQPGCHPAPNINGNLVGQPPLGEGKCYDVSRYIDFFASVKAEPSDVILAGIIGPTVDVETLTVNPNPQPPGPYAPCTGPVDGKSCAVVLQHSCIDPQNTSFIADPAVRISAVINSVQKNQITSLCDQPGYKSVLQALGQLIISNIESGCISAPFADANVPDCTVEDITTNADGSTTTTAIPSCAINGNVMPCWQLQSKAVCPTDPNAPAVPGCCFTTCAHDGDPGQHFGLTVTRATQGPPPNTTTHASCVTAPLDGGVPMCGAAL
jgi:hypothetical protein